MLSCCVLLANGTLLDPYGQTLRPASRYYRLIGAVLLAGGFFLFWHILLMSGCFAYGVASVYRFTGRKGWTAACWSCSGNTP